MNRIRTSLAIFPEITPVQIKRYLVVLVFLVFSYSVSAQYSGYSRVENSAAFSKQFSEESAKVITITSSFIQEKTLSALTETIASEGLFWFKRSNQVRIEYQKPFEYLIIISGEKLLVRDNQKENRINVSGNKLFRQVNQIIVDCVQGSILTSSDFVVAVFESEKMYLLEMTPTDKGLREFFKTIVLKVEKKNYSAYSIELNEPTGDRTTIMFTDKKINTQVSDVVFTF